MLFSLQFSDNNNIAARPSGCQTVVEMDVLRMVTLVPVAPSGSTSVTSALLVRPVCRTGWSRGSAVQSKNSSSESLEWAEPELGAVGRGSSVSGGSTFTE